MILLSVTDMEEMFPYILAAIVSLIIFYLLIKSAVKNDILSAHKEISNDKYVSDSVPETTRQQKLKKQYELGKINFETFKEEWNK